MQTSQSIQGRLTINSTATDIIVAGGGPAGCTVAIGLRRLGYRVALVHAPRPWHACEGISARTREGLRSAGLFKAFSAVPVASPRSVYWNGDSSAANTEHLVLRQAFDAALLQDAAAAGVELLPGRVRHVRGPGAADTRVHIETLAGAVEQRHCRFWVEARGRAAPGSGASQLRGPETVSLLQCRQGSPAGWCSTVSSFADGWAWIATTADGLCFTQLTVSAEHDTLPKRQDLERWFGQQLAQLPTMPALDVAAPPPGEVKARGSTSILQGDLVSPCSLRVGDAAMAVDPLSGNGVFQSLSSALVAPAVINTLLQFPGERELAAQFYRDRVRHSFLRFARTGRDFYRMETRFEASPFWRQRQDWPDAELSHGNAAPALLEIGDKPVVDGGRIRMQRVAVTSDQPLGIWHIAGVELAPLLEGLPQAAERRRSTLAARVAAACGSDANKRAPVQAWLRRYALL